MSYKDCVKAAFEAGKVDRVSTEQYVWKEGDQLIGEYLGCEMQKSTTKKMPDYYLYDWDTDDGPVRVLMSGYFDRSVRAKLVVGQLYMIEYKGKRDIKGGKQQFKEFVVYVVSSDE